MHPPKAAAGASLVLVLVLAALALLGARSSAADGGGSQASMSGDVLTIQGGPGANDISFGGHSALEQYIVDSAGITAGAGCAQLDARRTRRHSDVGTGRLRTSLPAVKSVLGSA